MDKACIYRVSVKAVSIKENKLLFAREESGAWDLLGGGLEYGESQKDCLRREIIEETGLEPADISDTPLFISTYKNPSKELAVANIVYKVSFSSINFTPSPECQELGYFSIPELQRLHLHPNIPAMLDELAQLID